MHVYTDMEVALVFPIGHNGGDAEGAPSTKTEKSVIFLIALASLKKNYKQNTITVQRCIYKVQASYTASTTVLNPIVQIKTHVTRYED